MKTRKTQANGPSVSIIIPTYNRSSSLKRAVQSALSQTFQDFEIIVIDDASTEPPKEIINSFKDKRIKFIRHKLNRGGAAARNTGIRASKGEYIAFLDSDDEWLSDKLECQIKSLENLPANFGAHYSGYTVVSSAGNVIGSRTPYASGDISSRICEDNCIGPLSTVIVKRLALDRCGFFDEKFPSCQDWELYIRIAQTFHFEYTPKKLVKYYISKNSITKNTNAKAIGHRMIIEKYVTSFKKNLPAYSRQLLVIGHYLCRSGQTNSGRSEFRRAIGFYPSGWSAYFYYICSFLGPKAYNQMVNLKNRIYFYPLF